ncbi:hypothetical protein K2173_022705 [Erythroxylum novogranatense]|uniref:Uncharacterized protein n=1 Tax=Erythroxylum novogranatense TaxID=1862640 RepID=A0AAV8TQ61_9ROSI|nr:hypothetical protein K2173_022705 [Erythroxylum novogranatense]
MAPPNPILIFTAAAFLFSFTVAAHARIHLNRHATQDLIDVSGASILIPNERTDPDPAVVGVQPKLPKESMEQGVKGLDSEAQSVPLTIVGFRPINRRFPRRPSIQLPRGHRCRHFRRFNGREIPYGNDMILSTTARHDDGVDQVHQIQPRWARFQHDTPKFAYISRMNRMRWPREHRRHHVDGEEEELELKKMHKHKDGFFLRKLRKFFNHFLI